MHTTTKAFRRAANLPDSLQGKKFYIPGDQGNEKEVAQRLKKWRPETYDK